MNYGEHDRNCDQDEDYGQRQRDESQKLGVVNFVRWICRVRLAYAAGVEANHPALPLKVLTSARPRQNMRLCACLNMHLPLRLLLLLHFPLFWYRPLPLPPRLKMSLYLTLPLLLGLTIAKLQIVA